MAITLSPDVTIAKTPELPTFKSVEEERLHCAGPGVSRPFLGQPVRYALFAYRVSDLLLVNESGEVVQGNHPVNEAAFAIHESAGSSISPVGHDRREQPDLFD